MKRRILQLLTFLLIALTFGGCNNKKSEENLPEIANNYKFSSITQYIDFVTEWEDFDDSYFQERNLKRTDSLTGGYRYFSTEEINGIGSELTCGFFFEDRALYPSEVSIVNDISSKQTSLEILELCNNEFDKNYTSEYDAIENERHDLRTEIDHSDGKTAIDFLKQCFEKDKGAIRYYKYYTISDNMYLVLYSEYPNISDENYENSTISVSIKTGDISSEGGPFDETSYSTEYTKTSDNTKEKTDEKKPSKEETEEETEQETTSTSSMEESNALSAALDYLDYSAFSHDGLIEQLEFEGYSKEAATYAADNCGADWKEQAAKKAQEYLDYSSFSRSGLIEQLEYEGFTKEQAEYGATAVGY